MASENEASCESDPNFAIICGFLEKFGVTCGLANIDFVDLQEMLENTQEVSQELIELHVKLMRRARRSVSSNSRWERALIKTCHTFSNQDAWEIERFGYKKARISSKLRILKELLEMQFDYNQKFKNEINKISAGELRAQPLGRDRLGRLYWYQCDENCQIRVYKEDADEETWTLVAKDRDGLVSLISQLSNGDTAKSSSEPVSNEDSNSVEVEKPTLDTGQDSPCKDGKNDSENNSEENMGVEAESVEGNRNIAEENASEDANLPDGEPEKPDFEDNSNGMGESEKKEEPITKMKNEKDRIEKKEKTKITPEKENEDVTINEKLAEENVKEDISKENGQEDTETQIHQENVSENALNLCSKDLSNLPEQMTDEKSCLDLSIKAPPCLRIKPITELMAQPQPMDVQKKDFVGIKGKYIRGDHIDKNLIYPNPTHRGKAVQSASYDAICYKRSMQEDTYSVPTNLKHPRFDRPTLLGNKNYISYLNDHGDDDDEEEVGDEEIEEPLMLVQGEGSGFPNQSVSQIEDASPIVGEVIEEPIFIVQGEGNGEECDTGNKFESDSEGNSEESKDTLAEVKKTLKPDSHKKIEENSTTDINDTVENFLDSNKSDKTLLKSDDPKNITESFNSPIQQNFFFGNFCSPNTSPLKTASLSFGASTVDNYKTSCSSPNLEKNRVEDSKFCCEKTDENIDDGSDPPQTKVPENVDIKTVDNNKIEHRKRLSVFEQEDDVFEDSAILFGNKQKCDTTPKDVSDCISGSEASNSDKTTDSASDNLEDMAVLVARDEENGSETEQHNMQPSHEREDISKSVNSNENTNSDTKNLKKIENNPSKSVVAKSGTNLDDFENMVCSESEDHNISVDNSNCKPNDTISKNTEIEEEDISSTSLVEEDPSTTQKKSSNKFDISDSNEQEIPTKGEFVKNESLMEITMANEGQNESQHADITVEISSSTTEARDEDFVREKIENDVDYGFKTTEETRTEHLNIVQESMDKNIVQALSSNRANEELDVENQNENIENCDDTFTSNEQRSDQVNEALNKDLTITHNDKYLKNSDIINITEIEEETPLRIVSESNEKEPGNLERLKSSNVDNFSEQSNKVDRPKAIELIEEDPIGNSIPDVGNSDNEGFDNEELIRTVIPEENHDNEEKTDCTTNFEIANESEAVDILKIADANTTKGEPNEGTFSKTISNMVDTTEKREVISLDHLEHENCIKDLNIEESPLGKTKEENEDKTQEEVKIIEINAETAVEDEMIKEATTLDNANGSLNEDEKGGDTPKENGGTLNSNEETQYSANKELKTIENQESTTLKTDVPEKSIVNLNATLSNEVLINPEVPPVIVINDDDANDAQTGIDAIKAIKITNVQAKCDMLEKIEHTTNRNEGKNKIDKIDLPPKEKIPAPQPLRFLRGRRPNQMLSVKSYATRNKNLVLRKETKPRPVQIDEKSNSFNEKNMPNNSDDPLLKIIKSEAVPEIPMRRSTRRKPGDSLEQNLVVSQIETVSVEGAKRGRGRQRKIVQPEIDSKRLRLSDNQISANVETIDLTSEGDGRKIAIKKCVESVVLKRGITTKPAFNVSQFDGKKSLMKNGPFLSCVNIQKLQEHPPDHAGSPLSVESSGGGDNSDVVIIEDDPLAVPEPSDSMKAVKTTVTLNSFQLDVDSSSPPPTIITRSLRKRGRTEPEIVVPSGSKRRKTKGKRQVDLELRRSIEEQKKQEVSSSSSDEDKEILPKRKPQAYKKKEEVELDDPPIKPVKKPRAQRKKTLLGLDVPEVLEQLKTTVSNVRQSRRIAQLKIKEEAERRKLEEITMVDNDKDQKRKGKKNVDKDYKAEKRKRTKPPTEEEVTIDVPEIEEKKTKRKRKRKDRDPRKIFDECNPWRSSSDSSSNDEVEEEEEEIVEYSEPESPLFKSDHEFSPESDIEDAEGEPQPLKRARTARKEDDVEDDIDEHACQKCGKSDHPEWILLCDGCDNGWHCSCLRPALFIIPEGDWFCPPCQHNSLVKQLEEKLVEFDKKMVKREVEVRRKERLAYVGISLANVLPVKNSEERRRRKEKSEDDEEEEDESASEQSDSTSESSSSSDSDEPIYQLRQRRQAHSYRFNDYDELINSAIQDEMEAVKGAGNQGRGKDISTIVNAEKEEMEKSKEKVEVPEELPPVVPQENKELPPAVVPPAHDNDSEEEPVKPVKKFIGRKKQRKLNCLDVSSGDDPDSDEDFKGSSSEEEDDDDEEDLGSDSSEVYGRRRKGMQVRRSTRARTSRFDKDFIDDESEEEELPRKKKSRSTWDESETEESDRSWGRSSRRKSRRFSGSKKKRSKKSKKNFDDSDEDRSKKKKRRIKYGGLDDDDEEEMAGRRTRGKKINYADVLASDSDDEIKKRAPPRIESDDDYVANEEQEDQDDEDFEKVESPGEGKDDGGDKEEGSHKKEHEKQNITPEIVEPQQPEIASTQDPAPNLLPEKPIGSASISLTEQDNFDIDNLNSSIDDLPDDLGEDNDEDDGLNPIEEINKNLEEMDEEEMGKLMEEEEYANKQLQLMAMQLEKEKKRREREAKKKEMATSTVPSADGKSSKKRGRKNKQPESSADSSAVQIGALQVGPDMQSNPELSEPPGITIPIFSEIPPPPDSSPKKRRGRGKGKKTLEKEAAAAAAAGGASAIPSSVTITTSMSPTIASETETSHIPTTIDTVANINDDMSLENAAAMHGAKLAIAAPPQPFSQTQPTPSVITRMLQAQSGSGSYSPMGMGHNYYADQPPQHADNPAQVVANAQVPVAVGNNLAPPVNTNQQLSPMSQPQQQYMHGAPPARGLTSAVYRQPPPNANSYHRSSPAPPVRVRTPAPSLPSIYHSHHPLDPSPSGGGPINVAASAINTPDRNSPVSIPPSSDSPLSNKSDPTPPPPPYNRPQMRFTNVNTSPIRQQPQPQNLVPPQQHLPQQQSSPSRNSIPPYHPAGIPPNYYGGYMPGNIGSEDALPPTGYHYSDHFSETDSPQDLGKSYDEENSGEFGGLVSYFSSQREDDLDT